MKSGVLAKKNLNITLEVFLDLTVEEAFKWMAKTLSVRHTLVSFQEDIDIWYKSGIPSRVSMAVEYKRSGDFDAALKIYSQLFDEMPTWAALYSSAYKVIAPAGRFEQAERAIQVNAMLSSFKYVLSDSPLWAMNHSFTLNQDNPYGVLAFWPLQDPALLGHLGAITMLKQGKMTKQSAQGYLNSIKGRGSTAGCPEQETLQTEGEKVLMHLPWYAIAEG